MKMKQVALRAQYRFVAEHAIAACRLQRDRINAGDSVVRHDLDFYMLALWRLYQIACKVRDVCRDQEARDAAAEFISVFPNLEVLRHWWLHSPEPGKLGWLSWFPDSVVRLQEDGGVEYLLDLETAQPAAEKLYDRLCLILEELPPMTASQPTHEHEALERAEAVGALVRAG